VIVLLQAWLENPKERLTVVVEETVDVCDK